MVKIPKYQRSTFSALIMRNLITGNGDLTINGRYYAIAASSLKKQCEKLGIHYTRNKLDFIGSVEDDVLKLYKDEGWDGFFSEGRVLFELLQGFIIDPISIQSKNIFRIKGKQEYETLHSSIFSNYSSDLRTLIIQNIRNYTSKQLLVNLKKLRSLKNCDSFSLGYGTISFENESPHYSSFPIESMIQLFESIGRVLLENIANLCMDGLIGRTGWPDLLIFNKYGFRLVEVKKGDKLILSQIFTFETLIDNGIEIYVFKAK